MWHLTDKSTPFLQPSYLQSPVGEAVHDISVVEFELSPRLATQLTRGVQYGSHVGEKGGMSSRTCDSVTGLICNVPVANYHCRHLLCHSI